MSIYASHLTNHRLKFIASARIAAKQGASKQGASKLGADKRKDDAMRAAMATIEPWPAPAQPSDRLACLLGPRDMSDNVPGDQPKGDQR